MIIKGKIEAKKLAVSKSKTQYATYTIDSKNFNTFDAEIICNFNIGDYVEIETEQDGKYQKMVSMKKIEPEASKQEIKEPAKPVEFHQSIEACRYEALDIAIKVHPLLTPEDQKVPIIDRATIILKWILEGK